MVLRKRLQEMQEGEKIEIRFKETEFTSLVVFKSDDTFSVQLKIDYYLSPYPKYFKRVGDVVKYITKKFAHMGEWEIV